MCYNLRTVIGLIACMLISNPLLASHEPAHMEHGPHHLSVLLAGTYIEGDDTKPTLGIDYEYRVNPLLGLGAVIEFAGGDLDAWTYLAVADIHITDHFIVQVGPGIEHTRKHNLAVGRLGVMYEFVWGKYTLSPQLHYDYHEGGEDNAIVMGVALGFSF